MRGSLFFLCLALLGAIRLSADEVSLVRVGELWRFRTGISVPSSPSTAWRENSYDDPTWSSAISGFSTPFVSDYRELTLFQHAADYYSVLLRRPLLLTDPARLSSPTLRL